MEKLESPYKKELSKWIGGRRNFTLLYQASRDGCSADNFHQKCNNKGPTVTVLYNTDGYVFGGYTSQSWTAVPDSVEYTAHCSCQGYDIALKCSYCGSGQIAVTPPEKNTNSYDSNAFIFRLASSKVFKPKIYRLKVGCEARAIVQNFKRGPCFGSDLPCFRDTASKTNNYFEGNETMALGNVYNMEGDNVTTFCGNNIKYTEIEVYQVKDVKGFSTGDGPWRKVTRSDHKTLMSHVETYSPTEGSKVKAVNVLLLGPVGAGKSSFFNSVNSVFRREITTLAPSGSADRSLTTTYRRYRVRSSETGETLKLRLCDTRGLESDGGLDLVSLMAVIEGHIPDRFQFNPTVPISAESTGYNSTPSPDDQIHCVAHVIDGTAVDVYPEKILQVLKSLQQRLNTKGIPQVVIVTKADKVCHEVQKDVGQMLQSTTIGDLVEQVGQLLGIQRSCVFPVKNYEDEMEVNEKVDIPILLCLKQVLRYAEDYILDSISSD